MKTSVLYRVAAVLLVLFAAGHNIGFRRVDPRWRADAVVGAMQTTRFAVGSFGRTYWDFYAGFGFFVTAFLLFAAVLAWQRGSPGNKEGACRGGGRPAHSHAEGRG